MVRAVMLDVPEGLLEERRRLGIDPFDEVWAGVLHMVPPPSSRHQRLGHELGEALLPLAREKGLVAMHEAGLFRPDTEGTDFRVPDLVYARPEQVSDRGVEGRAELVVEVLSPGDETYDKLPFYAEMGVQEVLVADPTTSQVELFVLQGGRFETATADANGAVTSTSLGVSFTTGADGRIVGEWSGGRAVLSP